MSFRSLVPLVLSLVPLAAVAGPVNLNTADAATLARELKGIGPVRAEAIVAHREKNGPFRSVDELALVHGIGQKVIDQNRENLRIDRAPAAKGPPAAARPAVPVRAPRKESPAR
jgi:competence protein ComEA